MNIDVHHHWIPREHIENIAQYLQPGQTLEKKGERIAVKEGMWELFYPKPLFHLMDKHVSDMEEAGIDMVALTMGCYQDWNNMAVAPGINNAMAEVQSKYPHRVIGLAHVPPFEEGATQELERCVKELGFKGVTFNTNTQGKYPDAKEFGPLYRKAVELDVPIVVHAASMPYTEYMRSVTFEGIGSPLLARGVDHTVATARIIKKGVLDEFPGLKFLFGHLGGAGFFTSLQRLGLGPDTPAYKKMKSQCFFDTAPVSWGKIALNCAIAAYGVDNVLMGSDYPAAVNDGPGLKKAVQVIEELELTVKEKEKVLGGNAVSLFKLN